MPSSSPTVIPSTASDVSDPTWEELLTTNTTGGFEFPGSNFPMNLDESQTANHQSVINGRETQHVATVLTAHPSTSSGLSPSYSALSRFSAPPPRLGPPPNPPFVGQTHKVSVTSTVSYHLATTIPTSQTPPVSAIRPEVKMATRASEVPTGTQVGRWTKREHELFLEGLQRFGKSWKKISSLVHSRTLVQIRTHAQKYLQKQSRAALKADAKAAVAVDKAPQKMLPKPQQVKQEHQIATALRQGKQQQKIQNAQSCPPQQHKKVDIPDRSECQTETPRASNLAPCQWKVSRAGDRNCGFLPLAFPSVLSASTSRALSATGSSSQMMASSTLSPRSTFQLSSVSKLDQLLQEDNNGSIPAFVDEYYSSPTAIEDDLLRSLYSAEPQWVPRFTLAGGPANHPAKRRRLDLNTSASALSSASTPAVVPALRPPFSSGVFKPLPAPANLFSPNGSPTMYTQQQSADTDRTTDYPTAWI